MYPQQPPPKKSGCSGCMIALAIVGGLILIGGGIAFYFAYTFIEEHPEIKNVAKAVEKGAELVEEAQNAPGTSELEDEGCDEAMVFDMEKLLEIADLFDAGVKDRPKDMPDLMVVCAVRSGDPPSCDDVAETYVDAVDGARGPFAVTVSKQGSNKQNCAMHYDESGKKLGSFDSSKAPLPPDAIGE